MILDRIDADGILSRFAQEGPCSVREIAAQLRPAFRDMDMQDAERVLEMRVDASRRRYGKGVNLPPQGYFYPSEMAFALEPHMNRGRLFRRLEGWRFQYDFEAEGDPLMIRMPESHTVTLYERRGNLTGMLTGQKAVSDILLARYDENGMLDSLLEFRGWHRHMTGLDSVCAEMYTPLSDGSRECAWYPWIRLRTQKGCPQRQDFCEKESIRLDYNDRGRISTVWRQIDPEIIYF